MFLAVKGSMEVICWKKALIRYSSQKLHFTDDNVLQLFLMLLLQHFQYSVLFNLSFFFLHGYLLHCVLSCNFWAFSFLLLTLNCLLTWLIGAPQRTELNSDLTKIKWLFQVTSLSLFVMSIDSYMNWPLWHPSKFMVGHHSTPSGHDAWWH